jgi:hypothetical protein
VCAVVGACGAKGGGGGGIGVIERPQNDEIDDSLLDHLRSEVVRILQRLRVHPCLPGTALEPTQPQRSQLVYE